MDHESNVESVESARRRRSDRVGGIAAALAVAAIAAAAVLLVSGRPASVPAHARGNIVLASALIVLACWWAAALWATRRESVRFAALAGFVAALTGAAATSSLVFATFGWIPPRTALAAVRLFALETPIWAVVLLAWPARPTPPHRRRAAGLALDVAIVALATGAIFWDFLIRPAGGLPAQPFARWALASWALVLAGLAFAAIRGSRPEFRSALAFAAAGLAVTLAGSYALTVLAAPPRNLVFIAGIAAVLLRLSAADRLRAHRSMHVRPAPAREPAGVAWFGLGAALLLAFRVVVDARAGVPGPDGVFDAVPAAAILLLAGLLTVRYALSRRLADAHRAASVPS